MRYEISDFRIRCHKLTRYGHYWAVEYVWNSRFLRVDLVVHGKLNTKVRRQKQIFNFYMTSNSALLVAMMH